jgi:Na+-driven multidrug efflux pump
MRPQSLTEGSISRGLIFFALPILYGTVLQSLNGSVNSIWVGRFLGEAALTATTNANTLLFLLLSAAFGLSMADRWTWRSGLPVRARRFSRCCRSP